MSEDRDADQPVPGAVPGDGTRAEPAPEDVTQPAPADGTRAEPAPEDVTQPAPTPEPPPPAAPAPPAVEPPAAVPAVAPPTVPNAPAPPAVEPPAAVPAVTAAARSGGGSRGRIRSVLIGLVFFLSCLSLVLATTTWWLHDTLLDTDHFVALTAPLASDPEVQAALVQATTTQIDEALDLGPIAQYVVAGIAREVYASDAFAQVWERGMTFVHEQLVAILRGESNLAKVENGQVVVNLFPVIDRVLEAINGLGLEIRGTTITVPDITNPDDPTASREELSAATGRELSPTFGVIPVADSAKLEDAQRYVTLFDALVVVLFVVTGLLTLLTLALARRRLRMVALLGLGGLAALLVARLVISSAADGLASAVVGAGPGAIIGGQIVKDIADSYREFARVILLIGLVAAVVATVVAWLLESDARARPQPAELVGATDGWFQALAGLTVALAFLLIAGLTALTLALAAGGFAIWLAVVVRMRRRAALETG
jgi:hypothetical protein